MYYKAILRSTVTAAIVADQAMNIARFKMLCAYGQLSSNSSIVENRSGQLDETRAAVERGFEIEEC